MKTAVPCGWPARPAAHSVSDELTATGSPSGAWLTSNDLAGKSRRQPSTTGSGYVHVFGVHCGGGYRQPEQHEHGPCSRTEKLAILRSRQEHARTPMGVASQRG